MLCVLIAWRLLSLDFSSVLVIKDLSGNFSPTGDHIVSALIAMTGSNAALKLLQVVVATAWIAGGWWRLRWLLAVAWLVTAMFNLTLYHFLQIMYMFDLPLVLMAIAICWPVSWRNSFSTEENSNETATWILRSWFAYITIAYFFAGISKLEYSRNWASEVGLAYLYPYVTMVQFVEFAGWHKVIANSLHTLLLANPWLDQGCAALTLAIELTAPLALGLRRLRAIIPLSLAAMHFMIWVMGALLFFEMGVIVFTFGCLHLGWRSPPKTIYQWRWMSVTAFAIAILIGVIPSLTRTSIPPFANYRVFGWSYKSAMAKYSGAHYALGYLEQEKQTYRPLEMNYGGYMEFVLPALGSLALRTIIENPENKELVNYNTRLLEKCARAIRHHDSNSAMLGFLSMPLSFTTPAPEIPLSVLMENLYLLKGELDPATSSDKKQFNRIWKPIGKVDIHRKNPVILYEHNKDGSGFPILDGSNSTVVKPDQETPPPSQ